MKSVLRIAGLIAVLVLIVIARFVGFTPTEEHLAREIEVNAVFPLLERDQLIESSDAIVVAVASGPPTVRWNSADGREWASEDPSQPALILRDQGFTVKDVLLGRVPPTLVVRGVGGTVLDVTYVHHDQPSWLAGTSYLLFLKHDEQPTREGMEMAWTETLIGQSTFVLDDKGRWINGWSGLQFDSASPIVAD